MRLLISLTDHGSIKPYPQGSTERRASDKARLINFSSTFLGKLHQNFIIRCEEIRIFPKCRRLETHDSKDTSRQTCATWNVKMTSRVTWSRCQRPTSFQMHRAMTVGVFYWKRWLSVGITNGWPYVHSARTPRYSKGFLSSRSLRESSLHAWVKRMEMTFYLAFLQVRSRKLPLHFER